MENKTRTRVDVAANYLAVYGDGITTRFYLDGNKPMTKPVFPEFMDIGITSVCRGKCPYCYQNSKTQGNHGSPHDIDEIFGWMTLNQRPFQVAIGGGEPTEHPDFVAILEKIRGYGIAPNYTTNGQNINPWLARKTAELCDGVAVSIHEHLVWRKPAELLAKAGVKVNLHFVVSGVGDVEKAMQYYESTKDFCHKFVLLPYTPVGRAKTKPLDYTAIVETFGNLPNVGFGAGFYEALQGSSANVSLYEPEMFSCYVDLARRVVKPSSFDQGNGVNLDGWIAEKQEAR